MSLADKLASSGGIYIKWADLGQGVVVTGTVTAVNVRQCKSYDTGDLETWNDGTPKEEVLVTVTTTERLDADDDGNRNIVLNLWGQQRNALAKACRDAGRAEPLPGDTFAAVWTSGAGGSKDPRQFAYKVTPGSGLAGTLGGAVDPFASTTPAPAAPAPVTATATPAPAPAPAASSTTTPAADKPAQVRQLAAGGVDVDTIASLTGYSPAAVQALINLGG